jgi:hypothetical protein
MTPFQGACFTALCGKRGRLCCRHSKILGRMGYGAYDIDIVGGKVCVFADSAFWVRSPPRLLCPCRERGVVYPPSPPLSVLPAFRSDTALKSHQQYLSAGLQSSRFGKYIPADMAIAVFQPSVKHITPAGSYLLLYRGKPYQRPEYRCLNRWKPVKTYRQKK